MKVCIKCSERLQLERFYFNKKTLKHRNVCKTCEYIATKERALQTGVSKHQRNKETGAYARKLEADKIARRNKRQDPSKRHLIIFEDSLKSDRKHGRENDLTIDFIKTTISMECSYCGDTELKRTLDRIDNTKGHTQNNVVCSCERCNYIRRHMPYQAWIVFLPAIRKAREEGLFGDWIGGCHHRD